LTLIEVLAATVILSTMLAGLILALGRSERQWVRARRVDHAVLVADRLLTDWRRNGPIPASGQGVISGETQLEWRITPVENAEANRLGMQAIRLDIIGKLSDENEVLASVEIVLPDLSPEP